MSSTIVDVGLACPATARTPAGPSWADATMNDEVIDRWVTGIPAAAGTEMALVTPRNDVDVDSGLDTCEGFFAAAAKDEGVAALDAHDRLPSFALATRTAFDFGLGSGMAASGLPDIDDLDAFARLCPQCIGREAVHDQDIGLSDLHAYREL